MRTPSLRRRVVLWSVSVLALLLLVVGVGVDLALGAVLKAEQRQRLESVASLAGALTGLADQSLADRLSMPGIEARITYRSGGDAVVGTPQPGQRPPGRPPQPPESSTTDAAAITEQDGKLVAKETLRPGVTLVLTTDSGQIEAELARFRLIMSIASVVAVALAATLLPLVLRRAMRPLDELTRAATETAAGGRGRRLAPQDPASDLGRAASQFDAMLEELEGAERRAEESADRLGRFLSDASHELRTPLAAVSAGAERLIREPLDDDDRDRVLVQLVRETRRDAPTVEVSGEDATVAVDGGRIDQVLANLIANAGAAGARRVRMHARVDGGEVAVRVSDDGPGIPVEARDAVFDRLVRLDPARSAARGGAGLGLPIARGLAEAHGGSLACVDGERGDLPGAVLELRLPLVGGAEDGDRPAARTPEGAPAS